MRILLVLFVVVLTACCSTTFVVEAQKCMSVINNPDSKVAYIPLTAGKYHVCVGSGDSKNPTLQFCSTELYDIPALQSKPGSKVKVPGPMPQSKYLNCVRGNVKGKKAWLTTFRGANVIVTKEAQDLTQSWKASDFPAKVNCDGFYTALVLNPKTPDDRIRAMFNQLSNCNIKEGVEDKAKNRVMSAVGMASDLVALIPEVGTLASLVIKACVFAENLKIDMTEDDRIKFLAIHMTIAKLDVMCGTGASGKKLQKCLADAKAQAKLKGGKGKYKISFEACSDGPPGSSDYLELSSDGHKVVTTSGGHMLASSPLSKLCSDGTSFQYINMEFDPTKKFCIKCLSRNTVFANTEHGEVCHSDIVAGQQSFNVRCAKTIKLTFTTQRQS